jgi:short-subunit dehydrogenase
MQAFVPILLRQDVEARIVNTSSMAGLLSGPFFGVYSASKAAVVSMSETLQTELSISTAGKVRVSVLCPGMVRTRIGASERNRSDALASPDELASSAPPDGASLYPGHETGMPAAEVAEIVLQALREDRFYILTHPENAELVRTRAAAIAGDRPEAARESREARMQRMQKARGG